MSTPRCCPPAYLLSDTENSRRMGPSAGHAHAHEVGVTASANAVAATPTIAHLVARRVNMLSTVAPDLRAGNVIDEVVTESVGRGRSWTPQSGPRRPPRPSGAAHRPQPARPRPRAPSPTHRPREDLRLSRRSRSSPRLSEARRTARKAPAASHERPPRTAWSARGTPPTDAPASPPPEP